MTKASETIAVSLIILETADLATVTLNTGVMIITENGNLATPGTLNTGVMIITENGNLVTPGTLKTGELIIPQNGSLATPGAVRRNSDTTPTTQTHGTELTHNAEERRTAL